MIPILTDSWVASLKSLPLREAGPISLKNISLSDLRREIRVQIMQLALVAQARCSEVS